MEEYDWTFINFGGNQGYVAQQLLNNFLMTSTGRRRSGQHQEPATMSLSIVSHVKYSIPSKNKYQTISKALFKV